MKRAYLTESADGIPLYTFSRKSIVRGNTLFKGINQFGGGAEEMILRTYPEKTQDALNVLRNGDDSIRCLKLRGYSTQNHTGSYDDSKKPVGASWTYLSREESDHWIQMNGHIGLQIPDGYILVDIDCKDTGKRIYAGLLSQNVRFIGIETPGGYQFIFKDAGTVKMQTAKTITVGGFLADYRLSGKGYTVLPTSNTDGRQVIHVDSKLDPMPLTFISVRQYQGDKDSDKLLPVPIPEGHRDDTLFRHASRLREWNTEYRLNLSSDDKRKILEAINAFFCEPPLSLHEIKQKLNSSARYEERATPGENDDPWPEPVPFDDYSSLPDFPVDLLPENGRQMVKVVSEVTQVDPGMTATIYLSVLSTCAGNKYVLGLKSHRETANLYTCSILPSGNRKSSTMSSMTRPLYEWEEAKQEEMADIIRDAQMKHKMREKRLEEIQKKASRENDPAKRLQYEIEASELEKEIHDNPVPHSPMVVADDITSEKLGIVMAENNECISIISTEGGLFDIMAGRYNEKGGNFDIYLKAHCGDPYSNHRVGRDSVRLQSPCLTMCLTVQPEVIKQIGENRQFRGKGLLARFLFSLCKSQVGYRERKYDEVEAIPDGISAQYNRHIFSLMDASPDRPILTLSPEADEVWTEFYNDIERDMRPGGSLAHLHDWGSKLPGVVARIAGALHFAEYGSRACQIPISVSSVTASCVIGSYYKSHACATFGYMGEDRRIESAKKILDYITRRNLNKFSSRDAMRGTHIKTMDELNRGIDILIERGLIRQTRDDVSGKGRPASATFEVNPKIFKH